MPRIDLNADVGEGFGSWAMGSDAELLALVTSANVACGFHAGDPAVMDRTVGLASTEPMRRAAQAEGLRFAAEAFADRRYTAAGTLQSRREPGSVLTDPVQAAAQAVKIATEGRVIATDGREITLQADTLCLHGDNPAAVANAAAVRRALEAVGVAVQALAG